MWNLMFELSLIQTCQRKITTIPVNFGHGGWYNLICMSLVHWMGFKVTEHSKPETFNCGLLIYVASERW